MIDDVDRSLRSLLEHLLAEDEVTLSFSPPTAELADQREGMGGTLLDLALFDVAEDLSGRAASWDGVRDETGRMVGHQPAVRRYRLSYLASAWSGDVVAEHRVLGHVLEALVEHETIPTERLAGRLCEQDLPVLLEVGLPSNPVGVWSAFGVSMRTSLQLTVVAPLVPRLITDLAPPAERLALDMVKRDGASSGPPPIAGRVVKQWSGVRISERGGVA